MQTNNQLREALEKLLAWLDKHGNSSSYADGTPADEVKAIWQERQDIVAQCRAALAGPPEQPTNVAAMHEALEKISLLSSVPPPHWKPIAVIVELGNLADAALSKPSRNCDRFSDELDAQLAFLNEVWLISVDRDTMLERDRFENWTDLMRLRYAKWLMAPTEEREGETDGSK